MDKTSLHFHNDIKLLGEIPNKTPCLIEANQYKINISRIDICQENPFPNYRINPDFFSSKCINLLDKKILKKYDLNNLEIPQELNSQGEYKYISLILENKFLISGQYDSGGYFWKTSNTGPTNIISSRDQHSKPEVFVKRLRNWREKRIPIINIAQIMVEHSQDVILTITAINFQQLD